MKRCTRCNIEKPLCEFSIRQTGRQNGQLRSHCKSCASEASIISQAKRREEDPEGYKNYVALKKRRERRGITEEEFIEMENYQNWSCYICGENVRLYLDHDHQTNENRKLLCFHCNVGLGHFKDSIVLLDRAINYLQEYMSEHIYKRP